MSLYSLLDINIARWKRSILPSEWKYLTFVRIYMFGYLNVDFTQLMKFLAGPL